MKTTNILTSAFILLALNVNIFATDTSDKLLNTKEANKQDVASSLIKNGRNNQLRSLQDYDGLAFKAIQPKGRNLETIDRTGDDSSSYAKAGRNKSTMNEMISMQ